LRKTYASAPCAREAWLLSLSVRRKGDIYEATCFDVHLHVIPLTGKREIVDPEGEFITGERIVKPVLLQAIRRYVRIPGASLFKVAAGGSTLEPLIP